MSAYSHKNSNRFHFTNPNFPFFMLLLTIEMTSKCLKLKWKLICSSLIIQEIVCSGCTQGTSYTDPRQEVNTDVVEERNEHHFYGR